MSQEVTPPALAFDGLMAVCPAVADVARAVSLYPDRAKPVDIGGPPPHRAATGSRRACATPQTPDGGTASARLQQQFATLCTWMEDVEKGEQFVFAYVPGGGTSVEVRGSAKGALPGKDFADALFKAWIGPKPGPGEDFKRELLGG